MRFFNTTPLLLFLVCSAFTSPLPVPAAAALELRDTEAKSPPKSVAQILAAATSQLQGPLGQLSTFVRPLHAATSN